MIKLSNSINIPFELDIKEYFESKELLENDYNYELVSLCFHEGDINYGHYTSKTFFG
jgi:ubiquitin C-terminal hydrolase